MGQVADDRDVPALERAEPALQRVGVEQRLGRVLVHPVAGVDHDGVDPLADLLRGAAGGVADDEPVDAHRGDGQHGVAQALALATLEPLAETLMTSAESHLPAISKDDRVRVESSKNMLTTVRPRSAGSFLTSRLLHVVHLGGGLEELVDVVDAEVVDGEQVLVHRDRS